MERRSLKNLQLMISRIHAIYVHVLIILFYGEYSSIQ